MFNALQLHTDMPQIVSEQMTDSLGAIRDVLTLVVMNDVLRPDVDSSSMRTKF